MHLDADEVEKLQELSCRMLDCHRHRTFYPLPPREYGVWRRYLTSGDFSSGSGFPLLEVDVNASKRRIESVESDEGGPWSPIDIFEDDLSNG